MVFGGFVIVKNIPLTFIREVSIANDAENRKELISLLRKQMIRRGLIKDSGKGMCSHSLAMNINKISESTPVRLLDALSYIFLIGSSVSSVLPFIGGIINGIMGIKRVATFFLRIKNYIKGVRSLKYLNNKLKYLENNLSYCNDRVKFNAHKNVFDLGELKKLSTQRDFADIEEYWSTFTQKKELQKRLRRHVVFAAIDIIAFVGCISLLVSIALGGGEAIGALLLGGAMICEIVYGLRGWIRKKYRDIAEGIFVSKKMSIIRKEVNRIKSMEKGLRSDKENTLVEIYCSEYKQIIEEKRVRSLFKKIVFDSDAITKYDIDLILLNKLLKSNVDEKYKKILRDDKKEKLGWFWRHANINKSTQKRILACKKLSINVINKTWQMQPYYFEDYQGFKLDDIYNKTLFKAEKIAEILRRTRQRIDNENTNLKPLEATDGSLCSRREERIIMSFKRKLIQKPGESAEKSAEFKECRDRYLSSFVNKGEMYI